MCLQYQIAPDINTVMARKLVELRQRAGYLFDDVVALSGLDEASLAKFECGDARASFEILEQLCAIYKVSMAQFFSDVEGAPA